MVVKKMVNVWCEIGEIAGRNREDVNVMNVNEDIVYAGCNRVVFSDGVIGEERVGGDMNEGDGEINEDDKSSTTLLQYYGYY